MLLHWSQSVRHRDQKMMKMLRSPCALGYCFLISLVFTNAEIAIRAPVGGTFLLHFFPKPLENPTSCTLTSPRNVVTNIPLDHEDGDPFEKIEPLGNGQCGARVHNTLSNTDAGRWILTISNAEESVQQQFRITTIAWEVPVNRTTSVAIGALRHIMLCGPSNNMLYCEMRDPSGNLAELSHRTRCQTTIDRVSAAHLGTWTCTVGVTGGHEEVYATHTLIGFGSEDAVMISANETSLGTMISWEVQGLTATALWCRAFAPNNETILVLPGMDNDQYLSVGTNLAAHRCSLLIKDEFPEHLHGLWRLEMGVNLRRAMGGFIRMPEGVIPGPEDRNTTKKEHEITELNVMARSNFRIGCQTDYSAGYCWIGGPNEQIFTQSENLTVGRCSQMVNTSTVAQHDGIWTCNMAHIRGGEEEQFVTRVNVLEEVFRAVKTEVEVELGYKTHLACSSVLSFPLEYCRFIRPDRKGFAVMPDMNPVGPYFYEGAGLDYGYCGLTISSVELVDIGEWTCATRTRARLWEAESRDSIVLKIMKTEVDSSEDSLEDSSGRSSSAMVLICGMLTGGFVLLMLVIIAATLLHKRKNSRKDSQETVIVKSAD